jgi:hypothetical protein
MTEGEVRRIRRYESELGIVVHHVRLSGGRVVAAGDPARHDEPVRSITKP